MAIVRDLALVDAVLHRRWLILAEFWGSVALGVGLAALFLWRGHGGLIWNAWATVSFGIGMNYLPLALYASRPSAVDETRARSLVGSGRARKLTAFSLLLVIPCAVFLVAVLEFLGGKSRSQSGR